MMLPEFMNFYSYTAEQALNEYAIRFFGLANSMFRLQGKFDLMKLMIANMATVGGRDAQSFADELKKQAKGSHGILEEVRNIKR